MNQTKQPEWVLYNYFRSSTSYRARIALELKNVAYEYKAVHLLNNGGEQYSESYKALNPLSEVPCLIHQGKALSQSIAILEYLDEVVPQNSLYPKNSFDKAIVRQMVETVNCGLHPFSNLKVLQYLKGEGFNQEQTQKWIHHWMHIGLSAMNTLVQTHGKNFCFGDSVTAADICLIPHLFTSRRFEVNLDNYPALLHVEKNCLALNAFKNAHPFVQPDTPEEFKVK
jgi:maleylacetoacetate isomerase